MVDKIVRSRHQCHFRRYIKTIYLLLSAFVFHMFMQYFNLYFTDEMGLGKTIQTISYLGWMRFVQNISGPFLIVVPLSVLSNWMNEFNRFLPQMRTLRLHTADLKERERLRTEVLSDLVNHYDVVVTTYEMVKNPTMQHSLVHSIHWRCVVLDEGHIVRNENSIIAGTVRKMHFEHAVLLTGTPLQNNLQRFDACFDIRDSQKHTVDRELLLKVHSLLKAFMLRRIKAEVEKTVPPKVEKKIMCPLSAVQNTWYKRFLLRDSTLLIELELAERAKEVTAASDAANNITNTNANSTTSAAHTGNAASTVATVSENPKESNTSITSTLLDAASTVEKSRWRKLQCLYMQLRKVCNHPFLFPEADAHPEYTNETIIEASGKMQILDRLLHKLRDAGHRVVIFSQFTSVLDILSDYLDFREFPHCRLDGNTNRVQRQVHINSFNAPKSPLFAFLLSTRAGGLGVNLQTADTVILYDSDWNPMVRDGRKGENLMMFLHFNFVFVYGRQVCGNSL